jgi:predicted small secreted protein
MKTCITCLFVLALLSALSGCNTVAGIGKDIQKAGDKIEEVAKKK